MTLKDCKATVARMDQECDKLEYSAKAARARYEHALYELIQAERAHAAAIQRRTAFEGRHQDLLHPVKD